MASPDPDIETPTMNGTAQVDDTNNAGTSVIFKQHDPTSVISTCHQIVNDNGSQWNIAGATASTYRADATDVGKTF